MSETTNKIMSYEMADGDNPESIVIASQQSILGAFQGAVNDIKKSGGMGLTWEQLDYLIEIFKKKKPTVIIQERAQ